MKTPAILVFLAALPAFAQQQNTEWARLGECGKFKVIPCLTTLFTDHPFHFAVTSLAPGNGFAVGPALSFTHHTVPVKIPGPDGNTITSWRLAWDADAVVSDNLSWRTGIYLKARYTREPPTVVVSGAGSPGSADLRPKSLLFAAYAQTESLNKLSYYGIGQNTSRSAPAFYGERQTIAGGNATLPLWNRVSLSFFGEANARIVSLRPEMNDGGPSIDHLYTPLTAPGLGFQTASFAQFAEGLQLTPSWKDRFALDYSATIQEYGSPGSGSSFNRLVVDLSHTLSLYGKSTAAAPRDFNGPDSCALNYSDKKDTCPKPAISNNYEGNIAFRFLLTESFVPSGNAVPFYFQPTLGGSDINGNNFLPSYADYRFRAPNLMLFRESFEHSIGKLPAGFILMADEGEVSATRGGLGFGNFVHSFAAGITLRAGGFPALSLLFAWGGKEGTHTLAQVNPSLLGGGSRPSLY
jgi:hypothetical protein